MNKKRLNITLPEEVAEALAPFNNKSKFIAEALIEKMNILQIPLAIMLLLLLKVAETAV